MPYRVLYGRTVLECKTPEEALRLASVISEGVAAKAAESKPDAVNSLQQNNPEGIATPD